LAASRRGNARASSKLRQCQKVFRQAGSECVINRMSLGVTKVVSKEVAQGVGSSAAPFPRGAGSSQVKLELPGRAASMRSSFSTPSRVVSSARYLCPAGVEPVEWPSAVSNLSRRETPLTLIPHGERLEANSERGMANGERPVRS
jgi:hypothetical protein